MNRFKCAIRYLLNNRLEDYQRILQTAIEEGYQLISLRDYANHDFDENKKVLILRHDVDHPSLATRLMFEIEKKYNAKASYYFRNSTIEPSLMKEIEKYGSEASFHFETIADFIRANNIRSKEELLKLDFKDKCLKILRCDIEKLRSLLDIPCETIASHGAPENRFIGIPNNYLTEDVSSYDFLGIKLEAYNKEFIEGLSYYISDTVMELNNGYRYGVTPSKAIRSEGEKILLLTHPNHWYYSSFHRIKKVIKVSILGTKEEKSQFSRLWGFQDQSCREQR